MPVGQVVLSPGLFLGHEQAPPVMPIQDLVVSEIEIEELMVDFGETLVMNLLV